MKAIVLLVPFAALLACRSGSSVPTPLRVSGGDYRFNEQIAGQQRPLEGTVSVHGDAIDLDTRNAGCVLQPGSDERVQSFRCGEYNIRATKANGSWEFAYVAARDVESRRTICDSYGKTPTGQTICTSQHAEVSMHSVPVTGRIHLFALDAATPQA